MPLFDSRIILYNQGMQKPAAYLLPRLRDVLFAAVLAAGIFLWPRMLQIDSDLGRHLTLGGYMLDSRLIPTRDLLSHTMAGLPRPAYAWLSQILLTSAYRLGGLEGVLLLADLIVALAFMFVYTQAVRRSRLPLAGMAILILAVGAASAHWLPRPHVFTFLMLAVWLERLEGLRRGEKAPLWQFPALMLVWANLHGGFIFGFAAWLAYLANSVWQAVRTRNGLETTQTAGYQPMIQVGIFSSITSFITPSGWGNWAAVLSNNSRYILSQTMETMPPNFQQPWTWPFLALLLLGAALLLLNRKRVSPAHLFLLGGMALAGLLAGRNIPLFAIAASPVLAEWLGDLIPAAGHWRRIEVRILELQGPLRGAVWPILLGLGLALVICGSHEAGRESRVQFNRGVFPVQAADWLEAHPQSGNMFNEFNWGGYLLFRLWPGQRVFLDSQTDFYGERLVREYQAALDGDWERTFENRQVEWVILPTKAELLNRLVEAGWQSLYADKTAVVLRKP